MLRHHLQIVRFEGQPSQDSPFTEATDFNKIAIKNKNNLGFMDEILI